VQWHHNGASDPLRDLASMEVKYSFGDHYAQALIGTATSYRHWERPVTMVMRSSVLP
jgi:hypothetical protein